MKSYSTADVLKLSGVTMRQLQWWDEQGIVSPVQTGHRRRYPPRQVIEILAVAELRKKGLSLWRIRGVLGHLRQRMDDQHGAPSARSKIYLLTDGKNSYFRSVPDHIIELMKESRLPLVLIVLPATVPRVGTEAR